MSELVQSAADNIKYLIRTIYTNSAAVIFFAVFASHYVTVFGGGFG